MSSFLENLDHQYFADQLKIAGVFPQKMKTLYWSYQPAIQINVYYSIPSAIVLSLCTKSLIAVLKDAKQLSEENGGGPFC